MRRIINKMGFFNKQEKEKNVKTKDSEAGEVMPEKVVQADINKDYPFVVQLYDIEDNTVIRRKPFGAKRHIDGANVYLLNEKTGFKEPFPRDTDEFKQYTITQLEEKIESTLKKLDKLRKPEKKSETKRTTAEELDLMHELKLFKGYKRSLELSGKGSYMLIAGDYEGRPLYQFNRIGNFKVPVFTNIDYSLRYMPLEADLATAGELLKLNEDKNGNTDNTFKLTMIGLAVVLGVVIIAALWFNYKAITINPDLADAFINIANTQSNIVEKLGEIVTDLGNVTASIEPEFNPDLNNKPGQVNVNN
jgi:hypothetical protein